LIEAAKQRSKSVLRGSVELLRGKMSRLNHASLAIKAAVCYAAGLFLLRLSSGFNGLYGQDSHEYLRFTKSLVHSIKTGIHPGDFFWPVNYPLDAALLSFIVGDEAIAAQLITAFSAIATIWIVATYLETFLEQQNNLLLYLILFMMLSPFFLQSSLLVMSDMLATAFVASTILIARYLDEQPKSSGFLLMLFLAACAVTTRYAVAPLIVYPILRHWRIPFSSFQPALLLKSAVVGIAPFIPHLVLRRGNSTGFLSHQWLVNWSPLNFFRNEYQTVEGFAVHKLPNILHAFSSFYHPGFIFCGIIIVFFIKRDDIKRFTLPLISIGLYLIFLAGIPYQNIRYLLPAFPLALIVLYPAFQRAFQLIRPKGLQYGLIAIIIALQLFLITRYSHPIRQANALEQNIAATIKAYPADMPIYAFGVAQSLPSYSVENEIINIYYEPLESAATPSLLLFNPSRYEHQWRDQNPMNNWNLLNRKYTVKTMKDFGGGWYLYQVDEKHPAATDQQYEK